MKRSRKAKKSRLTTPAVSGSTPSETFAAPPPRHRWLFRLAAATTIPLLALVLLELGLRVAGYGYDPRFFLPLTIGGERFFVQNEQFSLRFFPPEISRQPGALRMRASKAPGSIRIFILGESAAMGDPEPAYGPARYMEMLLRQRYPGVGFEVINVSFTAINSHVLLPIARECARHNGDLWIIYMGNNEMVGPYGAASAFGAQAPPWLQVRASLALQRWRTGQLLNDMGRRARAKPGDYASWGGMQMFLENQVPPGDASRDVVRHNFSRNLAGMVAAGLKSGAVVLVNTVAVNLKDSPPFASLLPTQLSREQQVRLEQLLAEARAAMGANDGMPASRALEQASGLAPDYATLRYEWGHALLLAGETDAAREQLQRACDADALAFRTDSRLNAAIHQVVAGAGSPRATALDAVEALQAASPVEIIGDETFYEHVHFNFDGAYRLGLVWAQAAAARLAERLPAPADATWASQDDCERELALSDWNRKFVVESMIRRLQQPPLSTQPNNPARLERLAQYERDLLAGMSPSKAAEARAMFEAAIAARPEDHFLHEGYGGFLQAIRDWEGSLRQWRRASELMPHDFLPWFQMGVLLGRQGRHDEARASLRQALAVRPGLVEGWSELGQSYGSTQDWPEALECFDKVCRMRPQDPMLWAYQAKVLGEMGRVPEAIEAYRKALALNPGYREARGALGDLLARANRFAEAQAEYESVLRLKPDDVTATFNLGVMLLRQGRVAEGRQAFQRVLQLDPNHALAKDYFQRLQSGQPLKP